MTKKIMIAAALGVLLFSSPSFAECNAICRQKCRATAAAAGTTVQLCIEKWSYINSHYGARASQFEGRSGAWNGSLCRRQCRIAFKYKGEIHYPFSSVAACIQGMCEKYSR